MRAAATVALAAVLPVAPAPAHVGGLGNTGDAGGVPVWLMIGTGGVVVVASFLFTSLLIDRDAIHAVSDLRVPLPAPTTLRSVATAGLRAASVGVLLLVVVTGLVGPRTPTRHFAILVVWVGWWAGYTMSVYAVGSTWPAVNPWRALADLLPASGRGRTPNGWAPGPASSASWG